MTIHQAQVPPVVRDYFTSHPLAASRLEREHPIITAQYRPGRGWTRYPIRKRVSRTWLLKMRGEGATSVQLTANGRAADFTIEEIVGRMRRVDAAMADGS
jgi:hypothetical protein